MRPRKLLFAMMPGVTMLLGACAGSAPAAVSTNTTSSPPETAPAQPEPSTSTSPEQPEAKRKPDMPPPGSPLDRVMRAHFNDALLIRQAVIAGTPEQAANPATVLGMIDNLEDLPPGWRGFVERMQQDARRITDSTSSAQAAAAAADLGAACGLCHQKLGGPKVSTEPQPVEGKSVEERMKRHMWASDRLWEGLVVPSSEAWNTGAKALSTNPFPAEVLKGGGVHARGAASDFAKLVVKAGTRKTHEERAALYAELLVTCGTCHRAMREATTK